MIRLIGLLLMTVCCLPTLAQKPQWFHKALPPGNYSGITALGNHRYAVVSDKSEKDGFFVLHIVIDSIKGRPLFIYTDGLNEAENRAQEQFGDDRLLTILRNTHFDNARQVIESLQAEVEQHRNGAEPNDDLTMMCIRVNH